MDNSKGIVIGVVAVAIAIVALGFSVFSGSPENVGGQRAGLQEFADGISLGKVAVANNWAVVPIPERSNQGFWLNNTGKDVVVDYAEFQNSGGSGSGVASTTYQFFVGTSTTASLSSDFTDPFAGILDAYTLATSSAIKLINSFKDAGTNGRGAVVVPNGQYVFFTFQQTYTGACTGSVCETATSTNRGFNSTARLRYHY